MFSDVVVNAITMSIVRGDWRAFIRVEDLEKGVEFYGNLLGLPVEKTTRRWVDFPGFSLTLSNEACLDFHVENFEEAAGQLEEADVEVIRESKHGGKVTDPFGNVIGLHDHTSHD